MIVKPHSLGKCFIVYSRRRKWKQLLVDCCRQLTLLKYPKYNPEYDRDCIKDITEVLSKLYAENGPILVGLDGEELPFEYININEEENFNKLSSMIIEWEISTTFLPKYKTES